MRRLKTSCPVFFFPFVLMILIAMGDSKAQAQANSSSGFFSQAGSSIGGFFSQDLPGALDQAMPLLFPPYFGGEVHVRPYFFGLHSGEINVPDIGPIDLEGVRKTGPNAGNGGIGLSSKGADVEFMGRLQFSRLSFRGYWNLNLREIQGNSGEIDWIDYRFGADFDIVNSYGVTFGINADVYESPGLKYNAISGLATKLSPGVGGTITGNTPITYGIHASYNPFNSWIVSPTLEFRYEWPYQNRPGETLAANASQLTQWEYAIGLKLPKTVLGSSGIRFGNRQSVLEFAGDKGSKDRSSVVTLEYGGYFGDFVWFY